MSPTVWALRGVAALGVWLLLYAFGLSAVQEHRHQAVLYSQLRQELAEETAPLTAPIGTGQPVAVLGAPSIGMANLVVVEGTASGTLRLGPGHRRDTVLPGQAGVCVIYGKSATFGHPFQKIRQLRAGEMLTAVTGEGRFSFTVRDIRRGGQPIPALAAGASRLVLETATGSSWHAGFDPDHTLFVDADLTNATMIAPADQVSQLAAHEQSMQSSSDELVYVVFWLQALLIAALAVVWSAARWGAWQTWLVGTPLLIFLLWAATADASSLLPNLV